MAVQIYQGQSKQKITPAKESNLGKYLSIGGGILGGVLGAISGSPQAAIAGATGGASLGGMVGGALDPAQAAKVTEERAPENIPQYDSAIARKLASSREDRLAVLRQAEASLPQLPPELREQYAPAIVRATMEEEKRRAMGMGA